MEADCAALSSEFTEQDTGMATRIETLTAALSAAFGDKLKSVTTALGEITAVVGSDNLLEVMRGLRDRSELRFETLIDLCGADYSAYGGAGRAMAYSSSDATPAEPLEEHQHGTR